MEVLKDALPRLCSPDTCRVMGHAAASGLSLEDIANVTGDSGAYATYCLRGAAAALGLQAVEPAEPSPRSVVACGIQPAHKAIIMGRPV